MRVLLLSLLLAAPLCAREITVVAHEVNASRKLRIENAIEGALAHVAGKTGLEFHGGLTVVLFGQSTRFEAQAARDGVGLSAENVLGYADAAGRRLVLNLAAIDERRLSETSVLRHELAHLVLGQALQSKRPLWFEEGLALWVENMPLDALVESASAPLAPPSFSSLADLDAGLRDSRYAGYAYSQARLLLELFVKRYGEAKLRALLTRLSAPAVGFSGAFKDATGEELRAFERHAIGELEARRENWWVLFLGANWWWLLFTLAAVLGLLAWLKLRKRGKSLVDQWEEQEKLYPSDPSWSYAEDDATARFREGLEKSIEHAEISDEGLRHIHDVRRDATPAREAAPSADELKEWLEDPPPQAGQSEDDSRRG